MFKILIVEDDQELRQFFRHVLIRNGYAVKGVANSNLAKDIVSVPDMLLMLSGLVMENLTF